MRKTVHTPAKRGLTIPETPAGAGLLDLLRGGVEDVAGHPALLHDLRAFDLRAFACRPAHQVASAQVGGDDLNITILLTV